MLNVVNSRTTMVAGGVVSMRCAGLISIVLPAEPRVL